MSYKTLIKDVRAQVMAEALQFVREKFKKVMSEVTHEVHGTLE